MWQNSAIARLQDICRGWGPAELERYSSAFTILALIVHLAKFVSINGLSNPVGDSSQSWENARANNPRALRGRALRNSIYEEAKQRRLEMEIKRQEQLLAELEAEEREANPGTPVI